MSTRASPFIELCELATRGETGEFICATSALEVHVYLQRGRVAWATSSSHPFEFARYIKEHSRIGDDTFRQVVDECRRERLPLGETLVAWSLVGWEEVKAALRHQVGLALAALREIPCARTMFLERKRFTDYNPELTLELGTVLSVPPPSPVETADLTPKTSADSARGFAAQLLETIDGAAWVEVLDGEDLLEAAPINGTTSTQLQGRGASRVPAALVQSTLGDDADFVALRSARGSILGARLTRARRSLWCTLAADSTFGAAVSTVWSLSAVQPHSREAAEQPIDPTLTGWVAGDGDSAAAVEIRGVFDRAREVVAALVLSATGEPLVGMARPGVDGERCVSLARRRLRVFGAPMFDQPVAEESRPQMDALGFGFRTIVTGERGLWCFAAELLAARDQTLWVLTDRNASQGLGWACLTALGRGLTRAGRLPERRPG